MPGRRAAPPPRRDRRRPGTAAALLALVLALAAVAGCATPPPEAYVATGPSSAVVPGEPAGRNARDEECLVQPGRTPPADLPVLRAREVFCGGWSQPAARIVELRGDGGGRLDAIAAGGLWRGWIGQRVACGPPRPATLAGGRVPARLLACTRRNGGWPHLALLAATPGGIVAADGLPATLPVIERLALGGPAASGGGAAAARSAALTLAVARLSADAFGAAEVGRYEELMALGRELNQAENYAAAEEAYRAALAVQERVLGRDDPNLATPLMHLALNLSNQGRHAQARLLFTRAEAMAPRAEDPLTPARLLHYRGMHAINTGEPAAAAAMLERAERGYADFAPAGAVAGAAAMADALSEGGLLLDPTTQSAIVGVAEARRLRGVALARAGRPSEGAALARDSRDLLRRAGLEPALLVGRSLRSQGGSVGALGQGGDAAQLFGTSAQRFGRALPGERPEAATLFLAGARLQDAGRRAEALAAFRAGARILRARGLGLPPPMVLAWLDALHAEATARAAAPAEAAALAAEMFEAAQLAQRPQTGRLVAQAAARLGASGGNPRVAEAVRRLQDSDRELRTLFAERDAAEGAGETAAIDARIVAAQAARAEAEGEAAAAAPGYRQLLNGVAEAPAVARVLGPDEALVSMLLGRDHGYVFALRGRAGTVLARRVALPEGEAARLVARVRQGMAPAARGAAAAGPGPFDTAAAHALHEALLAPLAPAIEGAETLLVAPDGPLMSIPFTLLLTAPAEPERLREAAWLVRRHAVVHVPSPQILATLRGAGAGGASAAPLPYAGFGDPVPPSPAQLARSFPPDRCADDARLAAALAPLPGTRAEVAAAREFTGAGPDSVRFGPAFTEAALRGGGLDRHRIVHLATHALLPGELSCLTEPAVMVSAPRGAPDAAAAFVTAGEVLDLRLDADLVILSACNTGTTLGGEGAGGEALSGLARAFFFAGARGLLVTHWAVDDATAALTIADTLRRQAGGRQGSAAALRGAQLLLLEEAGRSLPAAYAHPFHWASFALIGDGRRMPGTPGGPAAAVVEPDMPRREG